MKINEFANPRPVFKFTAIGDCLDGVIVEPPELQQDRFGDPLDKQLLLVIGDGDREYRLYARRQMLGAIGDAVAAAEVDEIDAGGHLRIEYTADKPTGAGSSPMKCYVAQYVPPAPVGTATLGDEEDPWADEDLAG